LPTISESIATHDPDGVFNISEPAVDTLLLESNERSNEDLKDTEVHGQCEERKDEGNLENNEQEDQIQEQELSIQNPSSFQPLLTAAKPINTVDQSHGNHEAQPQRNIESETPIPPLPSRLTKTTTRSEAQAEEMKSKHDTGKPKLINDGPTTEEEIERARREIREMQVDPMNIDWGFVILPMPPPLPSPTKTNSDNSTTSIPGRLNRNKKQRFLSSESELGRETDDSIEDLFDGNENFKQDGRKVLARSFDFENVFSTFNEQTDPMPEHEFSTSVPSRPLPVPPRPPRSSISTLSRPFLLQTDFPEEVVDSPEPKFHVPNPDTCYTEIPESKMLPLSELLARSEQTHAQFSKQVSSFHRTHTAPSLRSQWQDEALNTAPHRQPSSSLSNHLGNSAWAERLRSQFQEEFSNAPHLQQPPSSVSNPLGNSTWAQRMRSQFQPPQAAFASDSLPDARFSGRGVRPRIQPPSAVSATNNFHAPSSARSNACLQPPAALTSPEFGHQRAEASRLPTNRTRPRPVPRSKPSQTRSANPRPLTNAQNVATSAANPDVNAASTADTAWSTMSSSLPPERSRIKQNHQAQFQPNLRSKIPPCSITSNESSSSGSLPGPFKYRPTFIKKKPREDDNEEKTMNK
jgi:hypothetical protein